MDRIEQLSESIDAMDPYSEERDAFAASILGGSMQLSFDENGRILLPETLIESANLTDKAVFVGKGKTFEIWNEADFNAYSEKARNIAKQKRAALSLARQQE